MRPEPTQEHPDLEQAYPLWEATDWTERQRRAAIAALLLSMLSLRMFELRSLPLSSTSSS